MVPIDSRPLDNRPPDSRPPDIRPPDTRPPDSRPPDSRPLDNRPPDTRPPDTRPPDSRPPESLHADELLRLLVDRVADYAIYVLDPAGNVRSWNQGAERIKGYTANEIIGRHFSCFFPPEDIDNLKPWKELETATTTGRTEDEGWRVRKDGSRFWANVVLTALKNDQGALVGFAKITRDLTEAKRVEQAARRLMVERAARSASEEARKKEQRARAQAEAAEERSRQLAERNAFLAEASELFASSLDYETTLKNLARMCVPRLADWCAVEMVDGEDTRQIAVEHRDPQKVELALALRRRYPPDRTAMRGVGEVIRTGLAEMYPVIPDEMLVRAAQDEEHLRLARELGLRSAIIVPLMARGATLGTITLVQAESGRIYQQSDLDTALELARRASFPIDNARLYQSATQAIQARDEFLAIAGHELRTPVSALQLHIETMLRRAGRPEGVLPERVTAQLKSADRTIGRLAGLIDDLLDVSRITSGRLSLELAEVQASVLVAEIVNRFSGDTGHHRCAITADIEDGICAWWDEARIDQIVTNLLTNACKYGAGKPIDVTLSHKDGWVELWVRDQGIGIALEAHDRIFERFERAVSGRDYSGLGVGLWIVRELVQAHGGLILLDSAPGLGSTFTIRLPMDSRPGEPADGQTS